jgi:hypothetical protein
LCHYSETGDDLLGSAVGDGLSFAALVVLERLHGLTLNTAMIGSTSKDAAAAMASWDMEA